jgi:hypothetical protein
MPIDRSREMWTAAYFLARCGHVATGARYPAPPGQLRVGSWAEAYAAFYGRLGAGRDLRSFADSLKNARDLYDSHLALGRVGWREPAVTGSVGPPQRLTIAADDVLREWSSQSDEKLWESVRLMLDSQEMSLAVDPVGAWNEAADDPDLRQQIARRTRRGQRALRIRLLRAYGSRCCVSGEGPDSVLEAAHLRPHALSGLNRSTNAVLLRADLHCLFDDGLLAIHPVTLAVELHSSLVGTSYWDMRGRRVRDRLDGLAPDREGLTYRWSARLSG